jgi:hypothetical protein
MTHSKYVFSNIYVFITILSSFAKDGNCFNLACYAIITCCLNVKRIINKGLYYTRKVTCFPLIDGVYKDKDFLI